MKYVVHTEKRIKCVFVVDAENEDECDKKLIDGQYEYKKETVTTQDCYQGYAYKSHEVYSGEGDETVICSINDLCECLGTTPEHLERYVYDSTECGMPISWDDDGVTLVGYVEGLECDGPAEDLLFPFTLCEFNKTVEYLEEAANALWHEVNDDDDEEEE